MHQRRRDEGESFFLKFTAQCQSTTVVTSWQTPCGHCPTLTCLSMTSAHSCFSHPSSLKAIRCCMPVPEIRRFGVLSPIPQAVIPPFDQLLESLTKTWSCFFWQLTPLEILDPSSNTSPSTSNPQAHSHLHQPNLVPPRCTLNWYASQAQEESSTWSIIIGKLHNHTSTTDNKRLTMYHINELNSWFYHAIPIFFPWCMFYLFQHTRVQEGIFSYSFLFVLVIISLAVGLWLYKLLLSTNSITSYALYC